MNNKDSIILQAHVDVIKYGDALAKEYFYIPSITYTDDEYLEDHRLLFQVEDNRFVDDAYASKVKAGETLWQAVRRDLVNDFNYPNEYTFVIDDVYLHDTIRNAQDTTVGRVKVDVSVQKFDLRESIPLGMKVVWEDDSSSTATE